MKYVYKNIKNVIVYGIPVGEERVFDHEVIGGGLELVEKVDGEKKNLREFKGIAINKNNKLESE
jgi:hypothetical protein